MPTPARPPDRATAGRGRGPRSRLAPSRRLLAPRSRRSRGDALAERDAALARAEEHLALAQRAQADYANLKRRTAEERERDARLVANEVLLAKVRRPRRRLRPRHRARPGRGCATTPGWRGSRPSTASSARSSRARASRPIEALGRPFDPRESRGAQPRPRHAAGPEDEVVAEIRRGYRIRDRVLRPALVAVSDGTGPPARTDDHRPPPRNHRPRITTTREEQPHPWARSSASTSARRTRSSPSWRAASPPSSPRRRAAGPSRRSSPSRRPASASSASWRSARPSRTRRTPSTRSSASWAAAGTTRR